MTCKKCRICGSETPDGIQQSMHLQNTLSGVHYEMEESLVRTFFKDPTLLFSMGLMLSIHFHQRNQRFELESHVVATSHTARETVTFLQIKFLGRVISQKGD